MIEKRWLGKKSGKGFYSYRGKKKVLTPEIDGDLKELVRSDPLALDDAEIKFKIVWSPVSSTTLPELILVLSALLALTSRRS